MPIVRVGTFAVLSGYRRRSKCLSSTATAPLHGKVADDGRSLGDSRGPVISIRWLSSQIFEPNHPRSLVLARRCAISERHYRAGVSRSMDRAPGMWNLTKSVLAYLFAAPAY